MPFPFFNLFFLFLNHQQKFSTSYSFSEWCELLFPKSFVIKIKRLLNQVGKIRKIPTVKGFTPHPSPHSHDRTRRYLCSFPITRTPLSREKDIPPISGIGYRWQLQKTVTARYSDSEGSLFRRFEYSEGSLFRRFVIPKVRYSKGSIVRK